MSTPKPGEIRCPTCHRSTPPAAFCTQCGAAIPSDARVRPRGMDRDELQDRIRQRRAGGDPYRRGTSADEPSAAPGYGRFEPEAEDTAAARRDEGVPPPRPDYYTERDEPRPDITREPEPDHYGTWPQQEYAPPPPDPRHQVPRYEDPSYQEPEPGEVYDDQGYDDDQGYAYGDESGGRRGSGLGPVVILGFLALGVLALLGGAVLAGVFDDDGIGSATPSPTSSVEPSVEPTAGVTPTLGPAESGGGSPPPTDGPVTFPDGFIGDVEPCATEEMSFPGCTEDGSSISGDRMWVWIGFTDALGTDELVLLLQFGGQTIEQRGYVMQRTVDCPVDCDGYLRQGYIGLNAGDYELVLERNGEFADRATFAVGS